MKEIERIILDGLRSGDIRLEVSDNIEMTPYLKEYLGELTAKIILSYEDALKRRRS